MKDIVRIKSFSNGLKIHMDENASMDELTAALESKLSSSRKFFGNNSVAIAFEGKKLTEVEEDLVCNLITMHTDLQIVCIISDEPETEDYFGSVLRSMQEEKERSDVYLYKGSLINQNLIESNKDIIIIGDVNPGCTVVSGGSIFIFGGLYGEAYAETLVMAMEMAPEELKINDFQYAPAKKHQWGIKPKLIPQIAYVSNDKINIEPYTKELLDRIL